MRPPRGRSPLPRHLSDVPGADVPLGSTFPMPVTMRGSRPAARSDCEVGRDLVRQPHLQQQESPTCTPTSDPSPRCT